MSSQVVATLLIIIHAWFSLHNIANGLFPHKRYNTLILKGGLYAYR